MIKPFPQTREEIFEVVTIDPRGIFSGQHACLAQTGSGERHLA